MKQQEKEYIDIYRNNYTPKQRLLMRLFSLDITSSKENILILKTFNKLSREQQEEYSDLDVHQLLFVAYCMEIKPL